MGSLGDSYDDALAETINGLYEAEVSHRRNWPARAEVEWATLEWVNWYNYPSRLELIGNIPPAEAEDRYYQRFSELAIAA